MGYQCLGITVDDAATVAYALADSVKACQISQVDADRYEVDCDTSEAAECMGGNVIELAVAFDEICTIHDGDVFKIDWINEEL